MRKVTVLHKFNIVKAMRDAIATYTQGYFADEVNDVALAMYAKDIAAAAIALAKFVDTGNAAALHTTIIYFDTEVREHYTNVLRYIEQHALVASTEFCVL